MALAFRTSVAAGNTVSGTNPSVAITPVVGDQLYVFCVAKGNTNASPTCSDGNTGGTYALVFTALKNASADIISCFVRNALVPNTTSTTVTVAIGAHTATEIVVAAVSGGVAAGISTIKQSTTQVNQAAGTIPTPTFVSTTNVQSLIFSMVGNGTNPGGVTVSTNFTLNQNVGQTLTGLCVESESSGFVGTSVPWGSTSATAFASGALEIVVVPSVAGINVSKTNVYAVTTPPIGINVSKTNVYAVLNIPVVAVPSADSLNVTLTETAVPKIPVTVSDSLDVTLTEVGGIDVILLDIPTTDSLDVTLIETANITIVLQDISVTDSLDVTLSETTAVSLNFTVSDTLDVTLTEVGVHPSGTIDVFSSQTLNVTLTEKAKVAVKLFKTATDTLNVTFTEKAKVAVKLFKTATDTLNVTFTETGTPKVDCFVSDTLDVTFTDVGSLFVLPSVPRITQLSVEMAYIVSNDSSSRLTNIATEIASSQANDSNCVLTQVVVEIYIDKTKPFLWERADVTLTESVFVKKIIFVQDTLNVVLDDQNVYNPQLFVVTPNPIPEHQPNQQTYLYDFGSGVQTWSPILWCIGFNFTTTSQIVFNGISLDTVFVDHNVITANVPQSLLIPAGGIAEVHVINN